jgi:hypothetical protein
MKSQPFYPTKSELPLLLDGRMTALCRPVKVRTHHHHWSSLPKEVNYKQSSTVLNCIGGPVIKFADHYDFVDRFGIRRQNCEDNVSEQSPFGGFGDILWCKESFVLRHKYNRYYYHADHLEPYTDPYAHDGWKSPILMPKSACRLWLEVLEVKVCKLSQAIDSRDVTENNNWENVFLDKYGLDVFVGDPWIWYATVRKIDKP